MFPALLATLARPRASSAAPRRARRTCCEVIGDLGGRRRSPPRCGQPIAELLDASHAAPRLRRPGSCSPLWTASGYLGTFGRGMNRIYEVEEGRPFWEMRPAMIGSPSVLVVLVTIGTSRSWSSRGPVAESVAACSGLDEGVVFWWDLAKLPVLAGIAIVVMSPCSTGRRRT